MDGTRTNRRRGCQAPAIPPGAPAWVTAELLADTVATWQPYYQDQLTADEGLRILLAVGRLMDILEQPDDQAVSGPGTGLQP